MKTVLNLLTAGAVITVGIIAPGIPWAIVKLGKEFKQYNKKRLRQIVKRLSDQELISFQQEGKDTIITLSEKGRLKVLKFDVDNIRIKEPVVWDGKWRIVVFDIPEHKKKAREILRKKLKELGFYQFQKSTFLYPFECKDEISFLRANLEVVGYTKYLVVDEIEESEFFEKWFGIE